MEEKFYNSKYFHSLEKSCEIVPKLLGRKNKKTIKGGFCITHQVETFKCGWQLGWHYGTYSRSLR